MPKKGNPRPYPGRKRFPETDFFRDAPPLELYAVAMSAEDDEGECQMLASSVHASSFEDAFSRSDQLIMKAFPPDDGWTDHETAVSPAWPPADPDGKFEIDYETLRHNNQTGRPS